MLPCMDFHDGYALVDDADWTTYYIDENGFPISSTCTPATTGSFGTDGLAVVYADGL